jgi:hypothetical protein
MNLLKQKKNRIPLVLILMASIILLTVPSGCIAVDESGNTRPTVGQELIDLKAARDVGAISEAEYQDTRSKLLKL